MTVTQAPIKVHISTLGCARNDVDSEELAARLEQGGFQLVAEQSRHGGFAARRDALELDMRAANIRLAQAIEAEHGYGPRVTEAIDETHRVMGELQKETLQHLFAMRVVLNRDQAAMFDKSVVQALTADAR